MTDTISWIRRVSFFGTQLATWFSGTCVGQDDSGNRYYQTRKEPKKGYQRQRRWVFYRGEPDASKIPPIWHLWLHGLGDKPLLNEEPPLWVKVSLPNLTGSFAAWHCSGYKSEDDQLSWTFRSL